MAAILSGCEQLATHARELPRVSNFLVPTTVAICQQQGIGNRRFELRIHKAAAFHNLVLRTAKFIYYLSEKGV